MFAAALIAFTAAPVPEHLMRPPPPKPDPIVVGFRWWFTDLELEVIGTDGDVVFYRCVSDPCRTWGSSIPGVHGLPPGVSCQSRAVTRDEAKRYHQRGNPPIP